MSKPAVEFRELGHAYRPERWVFQGYRAAVKPGSIFAMLGPNGCGKTTLLKILLGALKPTAGIVDVHGRWAFVPQLFQVTFDYTVLDMVLMGRARCVIPGVPCYVTQRGADGAATFSGDDDRLTYLRLLRDNLAGAQVRILAFCLMTNHVHLVAVPQEGSSLSILFRRLHGRYAQYYNLSPDNPPRPARPTGVQLASGFKVSLRPAPELRRFPQRCEQY
jgi:REP element-mobilizing transposase RayT